MIFRILSIIISVIIGFIIVYFIRKSDKYEPEPFVILIAVTFIGGALSVSISTVLYFGIDLLGINWLAYFDKIYHKFLYSLIAIGPIEESSKFISFLIIYPFIKKQFNEKTDGLVYISCIALGFSIIENYFYANTGEGNELLILTRLLFSTPGHISFSIFMGIGFYNFFRVKKQLRFLIKPLILASVVHGFYDIILFYNWAFIVFIVYFNIMIAVAKSLLVYTTSTSEFRLTLKSFVEEYSNPKIEKHFKCIHCGSSNPKLTFSGDNFIIQKCDKCCSYISNLESIYNIFKYFSNTEISQGSYYQRYNKYSRFSKDYLWTVMNENYISPKLKIGYFDLDSFSDYLELTNELKIDTGKSLIEKILS